MWPFRKRVQRDVNVELKKMWDSLPAHGRTGLFPSGFEPASAFLLHLANALFGNRGNYSSVELEICVQFYTGVLSRKVASRLQLAPGTDDNYIEERMLQLFSEYGGSSVKGAFRVCLDFIHSTFPDIKEHADLTNFLGERVDRLAHENLEVIDRFSNDPDYGLVPEKPVYVEGFPGNRAYLDRLCTTDGKKITYERRGSTIVQGISGPVDLYTTYLPDGSAYQIICICLYGTKTSSTAPEGFILEDVKPGDW